jgi:hypothetical protein
VVTEGSPESVSSFRVKPLTTDMEKMILAMPGPDAWSAARIELESLAQTARQLGDWELAGFAAQEMIQHDHGYAGGCFALGSVIEHSGDATRPASNLLPPRSSGARRTRICLN